MDMKAAYFRNFLHLKRKKRSCQRIRFLLLVPTSSKHILKKRINKIYPIIENAATVFKFKKQRPLLSIQVI